MRRNSELEDSSAEFTQDSRYRDTEMKKMYLKKQSGDLKSTLRCSDI
jgi:hypothetical protein